MKLISLWQPWASLMAVGAKRIETRSWAHPYRGWLAIHAAKAWNAECREYVTDEVFVNALAPYYGFGADTKGGMQKHFRAVLPFGCIVAVVRLLDIRPTNLLCPGALLDESRLMTEQEYAFGNYEPGRYAWMTERLFRLPKPIPYRAHQGLCDLDYETVEALRKQWREAA